VSSSERTCAEIRATRRSRVSASPSESAERARVSTSAASPANAWSSASSSGVKVLSRDVDATVRTAITRSSAISGTYARLLAPSLSTSPRCTLVAAAAS
jgi:hypothetical protein